MTSSHSHIPRADAVDVDDDDNNNGAPPSIPPFWEPQKLNSFFLFPLQTEPLLWAAVLALFSLLLLLPLVGLLAQLLLLWAIGRYAFKIAALASIGMTRCEDYPHNLDQEQWQGLPWRFLVIVLVHAVLINATGHLGTGVQALSSMASSLMLPASVMVLIAHQSLREALNPFALLTTITSLGKSYLLLCLFLYLLIQGVPWLAMLLAHVLPEALALPALAFAFIYGIWVMAAMIGYVMYQNYEALDITPVQDPKKANQPPPDPAEQQTKRRDTQVQKMVQAGDLKEAIASAREWQRTSDSPADHRRFHRVLKLAPEQVQALCEHACTFIPLLQRQHLPDEALEVWKTCRKRDKDFHLAHAQATLELAQYIRKGGHNPDSARYTLALLQGFEKQFPDDSGQLPQALELVVRALYQGMNDTRRAMQVFARMQRHWPQSPCTQEAAWVLRAELEGKENTKQNESI